MRLTTMRCSICVNPSTRSAARLKHESHTRCAQTMSVLPLFFPSTAWERHPSLLNEGAPSYVCLQWASKVFPLSMEFGTRCALVVALLRSAADDINECDDDEEEARSGGNMTKKAKKPLVIDADVDMFTEDAVTSVALYAAQCASSSSVADGGGSSYTPQQDIPRDVSRFWRSLLPKEQRFLSERFPPPAVGDDTCSNDASGGPQVMQRLFDTIKLAEYLQCEPLFVLLCGYVALMFHGKSTLQLRLMLGIDPGTPEADLFHPQTLEMILEERGLGL